MDVNPGDVRATVVLVTLNSHVQVVDSAHFDRMKADAQRLLTDLAAGGVDDALGFTLLARDVATPGYEISTKDRFFHVHFQLRIVYDGNHYVELGRPLADALRFWWQDNTQYHSGVYCNLRLQRHASNLLQYHTRKALRDAQS